MESHETPLVGPGDLGEHMGFIIHPWGSQSGEPGQLFTRTAQPSAASCVGFLGKMRAMWGAVSPEIKDLPPPPRPPTPNSNSTSLALLD